MTAKFTSQFPYALNCVEFRTIRRKEVKLDSLAMLCQPRSQNPGMMPACIVQYKENLTVVAAMLQYLLKKRMKCHGIKLLFPGCDQTPVIDTDRSQDSKSFSSGGMEKHRVNVFRRNPHGAAEMTLIFEPEVNLIPYYQTTEFFYICVALPDRIWQSKVEVCDVEIPIGGTNAGIAGLPGICQTSL
jgi:hypothetical protein